MASLPAQAVYAPAPVPGPSGSHPVPHGHAQHAHVYTHAEIPSLAPQQERLPSIRHLPSFRELDFQPYSQPQAPAPAQPGQPPPPPPQAASVYASGAQRARQHPPQQQQHAYGQVPPIQPQQHIPDSPALAQGQVPAPGVGGRGRAWGAPPQHPGSIPRSPAPPTSAASSALGSGMMGVAQPTEYPQHHLPPPPGSAGLGGAGHGSMMAGQQAQSLKRPRSESQARAGSGAGMQGGSSVSVSPAAGGPGRSPHPPYTPGPSSHSYPQAHLHASHGPPPASPYAPMSVPLPAGSSAGAMSVNPASSPALSQSHLHQPQHSHQHQQAYEYSAYQAHQAQAPPSYAQSRQTPIPAGMYGAPPPASTPELSWQPAHHAGPSHPQGQQQAAPPPAQSHSQQPPPPPVQAYQQQHIQHPQQQQSSPYSSRTAVGAQVDSASTGRASVASVGSMGAPQPPSTSGLGGAFGAPSSSAGTSSDYMGGGAGSMSFSQPSSPSKPSSDLREVYLRKVCRPPYLLSSDNVNSITKQIQENCRVLYEFAQKHMGRQLPQPAPEEVQAMELRAAEVVKLLEALRDHLASGSSTAMLTPKIEDTRTAGFTSQAQTESGRAPKRPWEDVSGDDEDNFASAGSYPQSTAYIATGDKVQSMAEKDMAIIRSKRATNTNALNTGVPKGKYRKRSRATPPGKCHSCNIRETPEWRRGPDGARTLCNACGLHYAKLVRKRDKNLGPDGRPVVIDLEMLRASTRAANEKEKEKLEQQQQQRQANGGNLLQLDSQGRDQDQDQAQNQNQNQNQDPGQGQKMQTSPGHSSMKTQAQQQQQQQYQSHSTAAYQYPAIGGAPGQEGAAGMAPPPPSNASPLAPHGHNNEPSGGPGPGAAPQSWVSSTARMYGHEQSQSFLRTSHSGR